MLRYLSSVLASEIAEAVASSNAASAAASTGSVLNQNNSLIRSTVKIVGSTLANIQSKDASEKIVSDFTNKWLGSTAEEQAAVNEFLSLNEEIFTSKINIVKDVDSEKALVKINDQLSSKSYVAGGSSYTIADCALYWSVSSKVMSTPNGKTNIEKKYQNVARWYDQMQNVLGEKTASPALIQFKFNNVQKGRAQHLKVSASASQQQTPNAATAGDASASAAGGDKKKKDKEKRPVPEPVADASKDAKPASESAPASAASGEAQQPAEKKKKEKKQDGAAATAGGDASAAAPGEKKKDGKPAASAAASSDSEQPEVTKLEIKVGKILKAEKHPKSDHLLVEQIDVGEANPRTICSGISDYYPDPQAIVGKLVCVVTNLKPRKMADVESNGMVLAASTILTEEQKAAGEKKKVELVECHPDSKPGEVITFAGVEPGKFKSFEPNQVQKKGVLEKALPTLFTTDNREVIFKDPQGNDHHFMSSAGTVRVPTISSGTVS